MISLLFIKTYYPLLLKGLFVSLQLAFYSCIIGAVLGILFGICLAQKIRIVYPCLQVYVLVVRGTPMLIQIAALYYILFYIGLGICAFWAAVLSIGFNSAAYVSQIVVAGIQAVGRGQVEAAKTLGFNNIQIIRFIVLPQAMRVVFPALGNELVTLIKDSSLASTIGVCELTKQGGIIASQTYNIPALYLMMGFLYLLVTTTVSFLFSRIEKRW